MYALQDSAIIRDGLFTAVLAGYSVHLYRRKKSYEDSMVHKLGKLAMFLLLLADSWRIRDEVVAQEFFSKCFVKALNNCVMKLLVVLVAIATASARKFGEHGTTLPISAVQGFPSPEVFHREYIQKLQPLLMRGAAADYPARERWMDEKLLELNIDAAPDKEVHVETMKKENREIMHTKDMHFHDFLQQYNVSELYVVDGVPSYMKKDVQLPWPLQCESYREAMVECLMWFSSGGTSSVVHTDDTDNFNCLLAGNKTFVIVDPKEHGDKMPAEIEKKAYSSIDVDNVDEVKYPNMDKAEFYHVDMIPGDCLYIPVKWIHQVRSFGRNIAVNIWWDRFTVSGDTAAQPETCRQEHDPSFTLDQVTTRGLPVQIVYERFKKALQETDQPLKFEEIAEKFSGVDHKKLGSSFTVPFHKIFKSIDKNKDNHVDLSEVQMVTFQEWKKLSELHQFGTLLRSSKGMTEEDLEDLDDLDEDLEEDEDYFSETHDEF